MEPTCKGLECVKGKHSLLEIKPLHGGLQIEEICTSWCKGTPIFEIHAAYIGGGDKNCSHLMTKSNLILTYGEDVLQKSQQSCEYLVDGSPQWKTPRSGKEKMVKNRHAVMGKKCFQGERKYIRCRLFMVCTNSWEKTTLRKRRLR